MSKNRNILEHGSSLHNYYDLGKVRLAMESADDLWKQTVYRGSIGEIRSAYIHGGKDFMFADYQQSITQDTLIKTEVGSHTGLEITFMLDMDQLTDQIDGRHSTYHGMQQNVHYIAPGSQVELYCEAGKYYRNFDIYIDLATLMSWNVDYAPLDKFINAMQLGKTRNLFEDRIPVTAQTLAIINDIKKTKMRGIAREIYMKGKVFELLSHQINYVTQKHCISEKKIKSNYYLGPYDIAIIEKIARHIEQNTASFTTVKEFSKQFGMNEHKLKNGFKAILGKPIFEYAQEIRMVKAKDLLCYSQKQIKEIAYEIGYKSSIAFTEAFKRYYGILPKDMRG